jgi:hypothetical protein
MNWLSCAQCGANGREQPTVIVDDDRVRITTWTFGTAGDTTGPHVHERGYIVVPVTGGTFTAQTRRTRRRRPQR